MERREGVKRKQERKREGKEEEKIGKLKAL